MLQNKLSLDKQIADYFKAIPWKKLNTQYKNNFSEAVKYIMEEEETSASSSFISILLSAIALYAS